MYCELPNVFLSLVSLSEVALATSNRSSWSRPDREYLEYMPEHLASSCELKTKIKLQATYDGTSQINCTFQLYFGYLIQVSIPTLRATARNDGSCPVSTCTFLIGNGLPVSFCHLSVAFFLTPTGAIDVSDPEVGEVEEDCSR